MSLTISNLSGNLNSVRFLPIIDCFTSTSIKLISSELSSENASWYKIYLQIFFPSNKKITEEILIIPSPPTCIKSIKIICPTSVKFVLISCTDKPVTQTPLTDVNKASTKDIVPENGKDSNIPPSKHKNTNVLSKILTGEEAT